jgi:hypothetical protein
LIGLSRIDTPQYERYGGMAQVPSFAARNVCDPGFNASGDGIQIAGLNKVQPEER